MKEAIVKKGGRVEIVDSPIPQAGEGQLVIKIHTSGTNPKDWKQPDRFPERGQINQGDDMAGTVHEVGSGVVGFRVGDRVAAFHEMTKPHGSYAEYGVAPAYTAFHIPDSVSYEEAATVPLAAMTATIGLFHHDKLDLPAPWRAQQTSQTPLPLVVYGGASAVGFFAIQLAARAGIHPIIAVAGNGIAHVEKLLDRSKGDVVVDYRKGDAAVLAATHAAAKAVTGSPRILYGYDAISVEQTQRNMTEILDKDAGSARMTIVLPPANDVTVPAGIRRTMTYVGAVHNLLPDTAEEDSDFAAVYFHYLARGLDRGWFKGHNTQIVPGGLEGLEDALKTLREGRNSAVKFVAHIADTPGVGK